MRLDKYLANMHIGSRSEVKLMIKKGLAAVNETVIKDPGFSVSEWDKVTVSGREVAYREHFYYMLNKPAGVVTATEDKRDETVLDLFPEELRRGLIPVGRLDKDTVGLLLIMDDGALAHELLSPAHHVDKKYLVRTDTPMKPEDAEEFAKGIILKDETEFLPAILEISKGEPCEAIVTIREGKYHQIKRMLAHCGHSVVYLKRLSMGEVSLDPALKEGEYRELTEDEIALLLGIKE